MIPSGKAKHDGPAYTRPEWFAHQVDTLGVLGDHERSIAATAAQHRYAAASAASPNLDPYDLARAAIDHTRTEHDIDHREPIPEPEPIDLDTLNPATQGGNQHPDHTQPLATATPFQAAISRTRARPARRGEGERQLRALAQAAHIPDLTCGDRSDSGYAIRWSGGARANPRTCEPGTSR